MRPPVTQAFQAHELQHVVHPQAPRVAGAVVLQHLAHGQLPLDPDLLEDDPDAVPELPTTIGWVPTEHLDRACVTVPVALEDLERCGLACSVGTQQGEHLTTLHGERDVVDCQHLAV